MVFAVIDEPTLNAWCMPGGKMAIYTGIIRKLNLSDDEIGQIMGHEIAHALLGHGRERMSRAMAMQGGMALGSIVAGRDLAFTGAVADIALTSPNSRENESEADRYGSNSPPAPDSTRAPHTPVGKMTCQRRRSAAVPQHPPAPGNRIQALNALIPQMMPIYEKAR
jgi:predicted Zn-dependent protease